MLYLFLFISSHAEEILEFLFSLDLQIFSFNGYDFAIKLTRGEIASAKVRNLGESIFVVINTG